jgi:hypothetical protein
MVPCAVNCLVCFLPKAMDDSLLNIFLDFGIGSAVVYSSGLKSAKSLFLSASTFLAILMFLKSLRLQYFEKIAERIMDTGVSVRKRVIKIIRDVCLSNVGFSKTTDGCLRIISRINDEETSIQVDVLLFRTQMK